MRAIWLLVAAAALGLGAAPGAASEPPAALDPNLRAAVVRVELALDPASAGPDVAAALEGRNGWTAYQLELVRRLRTRSIGTGFLVNDRGHVVTNAHVLLSGVRYPGLQFTRATWDSMTRLLTVIRDIWVTVGEGPAERTYLAVPVVIAEDLDLAVLHIVPPPGEEPRWSHLAIGNSSALAVSQPVRSLGFPEDEYKITRGELRSLIRGARVHEEMRIVEDTDPETGETSATVGGTSPGPIVRLQHTTPTGHGSSGGPLVDERGQVVGVVYAVLSDRPPEGTVSPGGRPDLNLAIAANVLRDLLTRSAIPFTGGGT